MTETKTVYPLDRARAVFSDGARPIWSFNPNGHCGSATFRITPQYTDRGAMSREDAERACAAVNAMPAALARISALEAALRPFADACESASAAEPKRYHPDGASVAVDLGACRVAWVLLHTETGGAS